MSGIEVVGLVLAVIPLVISGLEHYAEGAETIKVIWNYSKEFRAVARKLEAEKIVFRNNLDILLQESVDNEKHKDLLDDLGGQTWKEPAVSEAIRRRLQASYNSYLEHVFCIHKALDKLRERLHIEDDGSVPFSDAKSFRQAYKRFNFALKKSAYLDLITEIRDYNAHLEILTNQTRFLQPAARSRYLPNFEAMRTKAVNIFETFRKGVDSSCTASHRLSLGLRADGIDQAINDAQQIYRVMIHHEIADQVQQACRINRMDSRKVAGWVAVEAEVRLLDTVTVPAPDGSLSQASTVLTGKKRVRFHGSASPNEPSQAVPEQVRQAVNEIDSLCRSVKQLQEMKCGSCIGSLGGHGLYCPTIRLINQDTFCVSSLEGILDDQARQRRRLTNADARRLAVSLATGMLHLYDTPWLNTRWNKSDIGLIVRSDKVLSELPFITRSLHTLSLPEERGKADDSILTAVIRNSTLFTFGIILVELCMEESIDRLHLPDELNADGTKNGLSDLRTADRLWKTAQIHDRFGKRWSDVVRRCIFCDLNQDSYSLHDVNFRKAVYDHVLVELEEDCRQFFNL